MSKPEVTESVQTCRGTGLKGNPCSSAWNPIVVLPIITRLQLYAVNQTALKPNTLHVLLVLFVDVFILSLGHANVCTHFHVTTLGNVKSCSAEKKKCVARIYLIPPSYVGSPLVYLSLIAALCWSELRNTGCELGIHLVLDSRVTHSHTHSHVQVI